MIMVEDWPPLALVSLVPPPAGCDHPTIRCAQLVSSVASDGLGSVSLWFWFWFWLPQQLKSPEGMLAGRGQRL